MTNSATRNRMLGSIASLTSLPGLEASRVALQTVMQEGKSTFVIDPGYVHRKAMDDLLKELFPYFAGPVVITGQSGARNTATALSLVAAAGAKVDYRTVVAHDQAFDATVDWDQIDALVIDEVDGWNRVSLAAALPALFSDAQVRGKGIMLIGQSQDHVRSLAPQDARHIHL